MVWARPGAALTRPRPTAITIASIGFMASPIHTLFPKRDSFLALLNQWCHGSGPLPHPNGPGDALITRALAAGPLLLSKGATPLSPPLSDRILKPLDRGLKGKPRTWFEPGARWRLSIAYLASADHAVQLGEQGGLADPAVVEHGH